MTGKICSFTWWCFCGLFHVSISKYSQKTIIFDVNNQILQQNTAWSLFDDNFMLSEPILLIFGLEQREKYVLSCGDVFVVFPTSAFCSIFEKPDFRVRSLENSLGGLPLKRYPQSISIRNWNTWNTGFCDWLWTNRFRRLINRLKYVRYHQKAMVF